MGNRYSPSDFFKALGAGTLSEPVVLTGMVKASERGESTIQFSGGSECNGWIEIPTSAVESVQFHKNVKCKDHEHPLVSLHFKAPSSDNPEASAYLGILQHVLNIGGRQPWCEYIAFCDNGRMERTAGRGMGPRNEAIELCGGIRRVRDISVVCDPFVE